MNKIVIKKEDHFNVLWFHISNIKQSLSCSVDALNQMCKTYSVSLSDNDDLVSSKFPCLSNMDLIRFVSHSNEPLFRVFQNCIMCCFSGFRIIIFHEGLCLLETHSSPMLLSILQKVTNDQLFKDQPLFYLSAVCFALIEIWKRRIQMMLNEKCHNRTVGPKNVFSVASEYGQPLAHAQQLQIELKEFRLGISSLLKDRVEVLVNTAGSNQPCSSLSSSLEEATCLYRQVVSLCKKLNKMELDAQSESRLFQTSLVAHNFFANIILSSCLIGATSGNSFGSNLNIPPYHSTKGIDGYLWYIVITGSFVTWFTFLAFFLSKNSPLLKYLGRLVRRRQQENLSNHDGSHIKPKPSLR
ncbi:hypothetical protein GpartN1_g7622.t1 [Galdieria partita]|uniref:Uncharacterized protein n=1 Tax=Galdieria partita TaxID=83374 RepID=A0A9C7Q440_9RHOD|nr:hypothetical protein GpartN1_g7622.t1 [Galdieria partita]